MESVATLNTLPMIVAAWAGNDRQIPSRDANTDDRQPDEAHRGRGGGRFGVNGGMLRFAGDQPVLIQKPDGTKGWGSFASADTGLLPIAYRDSVAFAETQILVAGYGQVTINRTEWVPGNVRLYAIRLDGDDRGFYAAGAVVRCPLIE